MAKVDYERRAEILKAIAHPSRLRIVDALAEGEKCVCELQKLVGSSMPTVSRHLAQMSAAGIIRGRREGSWVHYSLQVPCITNVFQCIEEVIRSETQRRAG